MAPGTISKILPTNMAASIYDDLRGRGAAQDPIDLEERATSAIDEENLNARYHDYDYNDAFHDDDESRITTERAAFLAPSNKPAHSGLKDSAKHKGTTRSKWLTRSPRMLDDDRDNGDDDVPASLLIEEEELISGPGHQAVSGKTAKQTRMTPASRRRKSDTQWAAARARQRLHEDDVSYNSNPLTPKPQIFGSNPRDMALWNWANVTNMDMYMQEVYSYYRGGGIWCICLDRLLYILKVIFVAVFTTFLSQCVNYGQIRHSTSLSQTIVPKCTQRLSTYPNLMILVLTTWTIMTMFTYMSEIPKLRRMQQFYLHLLHVPDSDIQTIDWQEIIARLMDLREDNAVLTDKINPELRQFLGPRSKQRLDAHNIANRLMRKENYLIAMFNKDILDTTLSIPLLGDVQVFSGWLQWTVDFTVLDFMFDRQGQLNAKVLKTTNRLELAKTLRQRFHFAGLMNIICAPLIVAYTLIVYFFRYFNEYQKNPAALGNRKYTPLAELKFREFNELPHLFEHRLNMSHPFATRYLDQFPKRKTVQAAGFVAFVAGALVSVLALASIIDPELFLGFEITKDRTVLFYLGVLGSLWAITHGVVPNENEVFMPEYALRSVINYTRYQPLEWKDRLHTDEVKRDFSALYQMKIVIFLHDVLSVILTPFVLWFSLAPNAERIIDFFREQSIHVDGLGYVCSFGVFDFANGPGKPKNIATGATGPNGEEALDDYYLSKHGKMAMSYFGFLDNYATNPKTGIPGHIPPGMSPQDTRMPFNPPPSFPGLMSPTLPANLAVSRALPRGAHARHGAGIIPQRAPYGVQASPMPSMMLDRSHMPSATGFGGPAYPTGGKSIYNNSRSRYQARNIIEFPEESQVMDGKDRKGKGKMVSLPREESALESEAWETSPVRTDDENELSDMEGVGGGVLGLLYQFQKAQTDGRPGVNL